MYNRNTLVDSIPHLCGKLKEIGATQNQVLQKSKEEDSLNHNIHLVASTIESGKEVGEELYTSFAALKKDYEDGIINLAFYKKYLQDFKDFFETTDKSDVPSTIKPVEVLKEVETNIGGVAELLLEYRQRDTPAPLVHLQQRIQDRGKQMPVQSLEIKKSRDVVLPRSITNIHRQMEQSTNSLMKAADDIVALARQVSNRRRD